MEVTGYMTVNVMLKTVLRLSRAPNGLCTFGDDSANYNDNNNFWLRITETLDIVYCSLRTFPFEAIKKISLFTPKL